MNGRGRAERGFSKPLAAALLCFVAIVVALVFLAGALRQFVRESLMQHAASSHYEILCPSGALATSVMTEFAERREAVFAEIDKKLGDAGSGARIRIVFDPRFPAQQAMEEGEQPYSVSGTTIRTKLTSPKLSLPEAADAQALLYAAWGKPGNARIARWIATSLTGEWRGGEIGMGAAEVEQRLGHKKLATLLGGPAGEIPSIDDQDLLGAAWISQIGEFRGRDAIHKLYSAKMSYPTIAEVSAALGTPSPELEREWQMWMYAYLAGMPSTQQGSAMPMNMPMTMPMNGSH